MLAVKGFFNDSGFIPFESINIPKGRICIITVLDETVDLPQLSDRQSEVEKLQKIFDGFDSCDEPLPPEFDRIVADRFSIKREIEL